MNLPLNILIVEDEMLISEMLKEMLRELSHNVVGQAKTYDEALESLKKADIDIIFLDINLNDKKTGIDLAYELNDKYQVPFIYLTSFSDKKTLENAAFTTPLNYLKKPFTASDIQTALIMFSGKKEPFVIVKDGHLKVKLKASNIWCIKSENNYLEIFTKDKKFVIRQSLDSLLEKIGSEKLVRIHRSHVVNIDKVDAVNGQYVLIGENKLPLSRKHRENVLALFSD